MRHDSSTPAGLRVLLSTVSSDSHTWNLVYLQLLCEECGYEVDNLGACVPDDLLIEHAARTHPDVIVLSSVNGHGRIDGARVVRLLRERPELIDVPVVIGGKLSVSGQLAGGEVQELLDAGFSAVFQGADVTAFQRFLGSVATSGASREPAR